MKLKKEAKYSDNKEGYLQRKQQRNMDIAKWNRQRKKDDRRRREEY